MIVIDNSRGSIVSSNTFWRCKRTVVGSYNDERIEEAPIIQNNQEGDI